MPSPDSQTAHTTPLWYRLGSTLTHTFPVLARVNARVITFRNRWFPPGLVRLEQAVADADSLLEVGCGDSSPIRWFSRKPRRTIGVDIFEPSIERSRAAGIHTEYHKLDVLEIGEQFEPGSVDVIAAFDLIEHLTEQDGLRLLHMSERIARRVVIFTPNGWLDQGEYDGNPWQQHHSGWSVSQFRSLGYDVHGLSGLKWLRGAYATPRFRPRRLWLLVSGLTQPIAWRYPRVAFHLLAVKQVPS